MHHRVTPGMFAKGTMMGLILVIIVCVVLAIVAFGIGTLFSFEWNVTKNNGDALTAVELWQMRFLVGMVLMGWIGGLFKLFDTFNFGYEAYTNPEEHERKMNKLRNNP